MRIGLLVDGQSELIALPRLYPQLGAVTNNVFLKPIRVAIQPLAAPERNALNCRTSIRILEEKPVNRIVVLVDRETATECSGVVASEFEHELSRWTSIRIAVVVKDRTFENRLIADPDAFPARFAPSHAQLRRISGMADHADGQRVLDACSDTGYNKVQDSQEILARVSIDRMAANSRSFRRFLRCVGHPDFLHQSRLP